MTLADALAEVVVPAVRAVFKDGEVTAVTVTFDPELLGGSIAVSLTAVGEEFNDVVVQGDVTGYGVDDWRERLRSDMTRLRRREPPVRLGTRPRRLTARWSPTSTTTTGVAHLHERGWHPDRMQPVHVWIRSESRGTERRAPVVPADVQVLLDAGFEVTVEESPQRIFAIEEYAAAGASVVGEGTWIDAPHDAYVLGIKELPDEPEALRHRHIYFAHAFKGQEDARRTLQRFRRGGGRLLDIEYLTDKDGRRLVAFGYWAGYVGAALGVLHLAGALAVPLAPLAKHELDAELEQAGKAGADLLMALVTGSRGRSGRGAQRALMTAGVPITRWDRQETRDLHKQALLGHDLLVNCVVTHTPTTPFVEQADLEHERRLRVLADVTCDVTGPTNMLPVNTEITTWQEPVRRLHRGTHEHGTAPLEVIAIDNLPSLLPREASEGFSADLTPHLLGLAEEGGPAGPWRAAGRAFDQAIGKLEAPDGS